MTLATVPFTFSPGTTILSAQVNSDFSAITTAAAAGGANADITSLAGTGAGVSVAGTNTNNNAAAGIVGEYISSDIVSPGTSVTSTITKNITSVSLTAGDWDVEGVVVSVPATGTTTSAFQAWTSVTSADSSPDETDGLLSLGTAGATIASGGPTGAVRYSFSTTTSVFLSVNVTFAVSTMTVFGFLRARRVR